MTRFVGAKSGSGVYQQIISLIPPHETYIEPFVGTGAVFRNKRPTTKSVLLDLSPGSIDRLGGPVPELGPGAIAAGGGGIRPGVFRFVGDGVAYLRTRSLVSSRAQFVYADPPYVRSSRADPDRDYYEHEWTDGEHSTFLDVVDRMSCNVMISGYWTDLYAKRLRPPKWRTHGFRAQTRGGTVMEWLWMNYPAPTHLHDYRYIGGSFPRRWRIHKRQRSWLRMLDRMPEIERRAMIAALLDKYGDVAGSIDDPGEPAVATWEEVGIEVMGQE